MKPCPECKKKDVKFHQKCIGCVCFICEDCYLNKGIKECEDCQTIRFTFSFFKIYNSHDHKDWC